MGDVIQFRRMTAEEILAQDDIKTEDVEVPEWGAIVTIRALTGLERDKLEESMMSQKSGSRSVNFRNFRARLIAATAIAEDGRHLFSPAQIDALGGKSAQALSRLFTVASRLSGYTESDVEELTTELGNDPSAEPGSDLQATSAPLSKTSRRS